jgi:hypothetical protein
LQLRHILNHVRGFLILKAIFYLLAHYFPNRCIRPPSLGDAADRDVTIGNHADQLVMFTDRQHAGIQFLHHSRCIAQTLFGANDLYITMHDLIDFMALSYAIYWLTAGSSYGVVDITVRHQQTRRRKPRPNYANSIDKIVPGLGPKGWKMGVWK